MKKDIKIGGLRQNCYALDTRTVMEDSHINQPKYYSSLEKKQLPNGVLYNLEEVEYPITSESVTSYVESSDYHRDPLAAIAASPKRVNLGDITEVQDFIQKNPQDALRVYRQVGEQLQKYFESQTQAQNAPAETATAPKGEN